MSATRDVLEMLQNPQANQPVTAVVNIPYEALTFEKTIASGLTAIVFLGTYQGKPVAIKQLSRFRDDKARERFKSESKMLRHITQTNISGSVKYYGYSELGPMSYNIVMEYVSPGTDALRWMTTLEQNNSELTIAQRYTLLKKTASAIANLHDNRIVHVDLKWLNVMVNPEAEDLNVKLTDFGFSFELPKQQQFKTRPFMGTFDHMAPEIFSEHAYSFASDIYAFGIMMYTVVETSSPFYEISSYNLSEKVEHLVVEGHRPTLENAFPKLSELIKRCWHQDPSQRPNAKSVVETLEALSVEETPVLEVPKLS